MLDYLYLLIAALVAWGIWGSLRVRHVGPRVDLPDDRVRDEDDGWRLMRAIRRGRR